MPVRRAAAVIDAYLQVLAADPTRAAIILVAAWVSAAFALAGLARLAAAIETRLAGAMRRRVAPRPLHGPARPFMRRVLAAATPVDPPGRPSRRPSPLRLAVAIAVAAGVAVATGSRAIDLLPPILPAPATTPVTAIVR